MKRYKEYLAPGNQYEEVDVDHYCVKRKHSTDNEKLLLFCQENSLCPLCGKTLLTTTTKQTRSNCEIAHIFPNSPTEEEKELLKDVFVAGEDSESNENKIALCMNCHDEYDANKTLEGYNQLFKKKREILRLYDAKTVLARQDVEPLLERVISALLNLDNKTIDQEVKLSFEALHVNEKIPNVFNHLIFKIKILAAEYTKTIEDLFKTQPTCICSFETVESSIRTSYYRLKDRGCNEADIFHSITEWLSSKTGVNKDVCEIITSFFVQRCDIYDKLS